MEKILLHRHTIPVKGVKKKILYHFSDSHLTEYDILSDEKETEKAKKQTLAWENVREGFAVGNGEPYEEMQKLSAREHFINLIEATSDGDALVIAGDTLDYVSGANIRLAEEGFRSVKCPMIAVCGNHEDAKDIPETGAVSVLKKSIQKIEFEDLIIIGFDNSKRSISTQQNEALKQALESGKAVVIAMHVPIMTEGNEQALRRAGEYFQLNYDGCPKENLEFIELIKTHAERIAAVLAGHLHFNCISEITEGVTQYVSSQGITGNINQYIIGE